ncbi:DNA-binding MarR family transcriptional regulator [Saccharothrix coeruleofusca]|uniref:MarR family winged helix-turn-helix transcriptional regulator n=1 Tax=Saccharothrix coeruleofusca TaxID=33919 RepID=UPI0027DAC353|nr:MarR family winged helix-turn-helix transcriptional regulator [Saccharothrix coeruleofusca]MBP2336863.1 DNA-binding MarR family transcriptional regulator [Saccharothrix coeruleofusca]
MDTKAQRDALQDRIRDLMRTVRLVKQSQGESSPALPPGLIGTLSMIDNFTGHPTGCHAKELAARAGLDPSTVSRAVGALVTHGLVERRADPGDGRASILAITPEGHAALAAARGWYDDLMSRALADWRTDEVAALISMLTRLTTDIEGAVGSASTMEAAP